MARRPGLRGTCAAVVVAAVALLTSLLLPSGSAAADIAPPPTLDEVLTALGIGRVPTDYVVLVDTSRSMAENGRYDKVKTGLQDLLGRLDATDRVSLLRFAGEPAVVGRSDPLNAKAAIDRLPAAPDGDSTDMGACLSAAFSLLERADADQAGVILLITDGGHAPPEGSDYPDGPGGAWPELAQRGRALADRVQGFALPLRTGETGAPLLSRVLPGTVTLDLEGKDLAGYLDDLPQQFRLTSARDRVRGDLSGGAEATWSLPDGVPDLSSASAAVSIELRTTTAVLPVRLSGLHVEGTPDLVVTGLPEDVVLTPGQPQRFTVQVSASSTVGGWRLGRTTEDVRAQLHLTGHVDTPWRPVLEQDLGQQLALRPLDASTSWTVGVTTGLSWWAVVAAAAFVLVALVFVGLLYGRSRPRLAGTLTIERSDDTTKTIDLTGKRTVRFARLAAPSPDEADGSYQVRGGKDGRPVVRYRPEHGETEERVFRHGEWIDVGGLLLGWVLKPKR